MRLQQTALRNALLANAVFSGLSALALAVAAEPLGRLLGSVSPVLLHVIAGGLALFCFDLFQQARSDTLNPARALGATIADLVWVAGSAVLLIIRPEPLSSTGLLVVAAVALIVLTFAAFQLVGLHRLARVPMRSSPDDES